jgi:hypothetical protein
MCLRSCRHSIHYQIPCICFGFLMCDFNRCNPWLSSCWEEDNTMTINFEEENLQKLSSVNLDAL